MTGSASRTASFTLTDARYVGAKVAADLRLLNSLYGKPSLGDLEDYAEEVALLLNDGYLNTVDYGFRDTADNTWRLRLRYRATTGGQLADSRPGSLPRSLDLERYRFYSYLTYSTSFNSLDLAEQQGVKAALPITRTGAEEPSSLFGTTTGGHGYARHGTGMARDVFIASS